jgi:hypothetical protein
MDRLLGFENVMFINNKNKSISTWNVDLCDVLFYEEMVD